MHDLNLRKSQSFYTKKSGKKPPLGRFMKQYQRGSFINRMSNKNCIVISTPQSGQKNGISSPSCLKQQQQLSILDILKKHNINKYLGQLNHQLIKQSTLLTIKKNIILDQGVYILISGKLIFANFQTQINDLQEKIRNRDHLFNLGLSGYFTNFSIDPVQPCEALKKGIYTICIQEPYTLIQCSQITQNSHMHPTATTNYMTCEQSTLLKLPIIIQNKQDSDSRVVSKHQLNYQLFKQKRKDIIQNANFHHQKNQGMKIFEVNLKAPHLFSYRSYSCHNFVKLTKLGIIIQGSLIPDRKYNQYSRSFPTTNKMQYFTLQKYAVLLPNVKYHVLSAYANILEFQNNQTLLYKSKQLISSIKNCRMIKKQKNSVQKINKRVFSSQSLHKPDLKGNYVKNSPLHNSYMKTRKRQLFNISKDYEQFFIVSMENCKQNLSALSNFSLFKQDKSSQKYKKPNILFDYNNTSHNKFRPSLKKVFNGNKSITKLLQEIKGKKKERNHKKFDHKAIMKKYWDLGQKRIQEKENLSNQISFEFLDKNQNESKIKFLRNKLKKQTALTFHQENNQ